MQFYQLAIPAPKAPDSIYNKEAAERGMIVFNVKGKCASCHIPLYLQNQDGIRISHRILALMIFSQTGHPDKTYVTQGLKGLWTHVKGGFYHDGRFTTLMDVVNHYNDFKKLTLTEAEKKDLVEYLKSL